MTPGFEVRFLQKGGLELFNATTDRFGHFLGADCRGVVAVGFSCQVLN